MQGYDYGQGGAYFITICVHKRLCLFGSVVDNDVVLSPAGEMVWSWWDRLPRKFPGIDSDAFVVMPNHVHAIIVIASDVGATPRGRPVDQSGTHDACAEGGRARGPAPTPVRFDEATRSLGRPSLGAVVGWFKAITTNAYIRGVKQRGWPRFSKRFWQRNYYEHVIRNEHDLNEIRQYIAHNATRWAEDSENPLRR